MAETLAERVNTVVIGGGQAGLSVGYHLSRLGVEFVILDASPRIGIRGAVRWESLRLFTPARHAGLRRLPYPGPRYYFPTRGPTAIYLEAYARHFAPPIVSASASNGCRGWRAVPRRHQPRPL